MHMPADLAHRLTIYIYIIIALTLICGTHTIYARSMRSTFCSEINLGTELMSEGQSLWLNKNGIHHRFTPMFRFVEYTFIIE